MSNKMKLSDAIKALEDIEIILASSNDKKLKMRPQFEAINIGNVSRIELSYIIIIEAEGLFNTTYNLIEAIRTYNSLI